MDVVSGCGEWVWHVREEDGLYFFIIMHPCVSSLKGLPVSCIAQMK